MEEYIQELETKVSILDTTEKHIFQVSFFILVIQKAPPQFLTGEEMCFRVFFLSQVEEKAKELESMRSEMKEMIGSLVPSHVAASLVETQTYTPETLEHSTVAAMRLSNFSELSSSVTPDIMVKLLNAINDVIDDVILEQDVDKITSNPGTFMLISGLRHKHERKHVMAMTLAALEICSKCRLLRKPPSHCDVINDFIHTYKAFQEQKDNAQTAAEISEKTIVPKLMCCLATGPVLLGVIGSK